MAYNNPFWDFVRDISAAPQVPRAEPQPQASAQEPFESFNPAFQSGFPFAPFVFGPGQHAYHGGPRGRGRCGRACPRHECPAMSPEAPRSPSHGPGGEWQEHPQAPHFGHPGHGPHGHGHGHGRRGRHGPGRHGPPPPFAFAQQAGAPFDMSALINSLASHPIAVALRTYVEEANRGNESAENTDPNVTAAENASAETLVDKERENVEETSTFAPALDVFSTPTAYVLHIALPGAKKEDVGVNWDAEKGELNVAGVVYRAGDEEFLGGLKRSERRVGLFERNVRLPLEGEEKVEVDSDNIAAKLEDGVLVVTIGKVEKEEKWTDLKRVDIE